MRAAALNAELLLFFLLLVWHWLATTRWCTAVCRASLMRGSKPIFACFPTLVDGDLQQRALSTALMRGPDEVTRWYPDLPELVEVPGRSSSIEPTD